MQKVIDFIKKDDRRSAWLFVLVLSIFLFLAAGRISLWDQDEAAYAGFAKNMLQDHNWLLPHFTWSEVHRKPPFHFWAIAFSFKIFGVNEFGLRFPSIFFSMCTLLCVFFWGEKIFGKKQSFVAMLVLSTSFLFISLANISVTDGTLLFFTTVCALALLHVLLFKNTFFVWLFWLAFALAILTKGPPIIIFVAIFSCLLFIFHPLRKNLFCLHPWFFLPLAILPFFYWVYLCWQSEEGKNFILWMWDWYVLKRVSGSVFGQTGPPGTHLIAIAIFFISYLVFFPKALILFVKNTFNKDKNSLFLLSIWFISAWFIFEFSPSKLPAYVVAAHVPMAFFMAHILLQQKNISTLAQGIQFFIALIFALFIGASTFFLPVSKNTHLIAMCVSLVLVFLLVYFFIFKKSFSFPKKLLFYNFIFQLLVWVLVVPAFDELKNASKRTANIARQWGDENTKIIVANNVGHPPSLIFYLEKNFKQVKECYNENELFELFLAENKSIFILSKELKNNFIAKYPKLQVKEIYHYIGDGMQPYSYFLINNK